MTSSCYSLLLFFVPFEQRVSIVLLLLLQSVWATERDADLPVKMGTAGAAARPAKTVFEVFQKAVENHGENPALKFKDTSGVSFISCCC